MISKGARIQKCCSAESDGHKDGDQGTVVDIIPIPESEKLLLLASIRSNTNIVQPDKDYQPECGYFVKWDDFNIPVFVSDYRIKPL